MAISGSDGSIVLTTKIDEAGLKMGFASMRNLVGKVGKSFAVIGAAAATATVAITKMAVDAYADYEQLVGGVETLFKDSAGKVLEYANQAFATTGQSANEYMQNVTAFSASLLSAVGGDTERAADIANAAMISISDNVNKMGSSAESVQMAFQGFAKQQYMLLDNLKLGYGGTKTEMERLLKDAQAITGVKYDIDNLADVYTAIGVIQEKLGIAGTTAKEAESTISGAAAMMKASWKNTLSAIAGGGDIDRAINNLVYSVQKYFENIVPVVERSLVGIGRLIERVAPMLVQNVASALIQSIPSLLNAIYQMIIGLAKGILQGIKALFTGGSGSVTAEIKTAVGGIANEAGNASTGMKKLGDATEKAGKQAKKSLAAFDDLQILTASVASSAGKAAEGMSGAVSGIGGGIGTGFDLGIQADDSSWIDTILEKLEPLKLALQDFYNLFLLPIGNWTLGEGFPRFVNAISNQLALVDWNNLLGALSTLWESVTPFAVNLGEGLLWFWENAITPLIGWALNNLIPAQIDLISAAIQFIDEIIQAAEPALLWFWDTFLVPIRDYIWQAIIDYINLLTDAFKVLTDWAKNNQSTVENIAEVVLGFLAGIWIYKTTKKLIDFCVNLGNAFVKLGNKMVMGGLQGAFFAASVGILAAGIITLANQWDKMTPAERAITILGGLAAAATAAAIAVGIFHTAWTVGIAAAAIAGGLSLLGLSFAFSDAGDTGDAAKQAADNFYSSYDWDRNFTLPALAKGAVLPPNKPFLALVGDQKYGTNIEAPLQTIVDAFNIALQGNANYGGGNTEVVLEIDGREFGRAVVEQGNRENRRIGTRLVIV